MLDSILFSKPLHPGSDYIANRKYQQHTADDQEQGRQDDADVEPQLPWAVFRFQEASAAQGGGERLIQKHGDCRVQSSFDQIKGQKRRKQQFRHSVSRDSHVNRRNQIIPEHHGRRLAPASPEQADHGPGQRALSFVEERGGTGKAAAGNDVHDAAQDASPADGNHLRQRDDDADAQRSEGAVYQPADHDDDILGVILQKEHQGDAAKHRGGVSQRTEHACGCEFLCPVDFAEIHLEYLLKKLTPESIQMPFRCDFLRRIEMSTEQFGKKSTKISQNPSDNLNTPSLIRTIPSVPEFHRPPCFRTRGLSPPIGNSRP